MSKSKPRLSGTLLDALTYEDGSLFHDGRGRPVAIPTASAPLADTHGHLTHFREHDPASALARAALAGVALLGVPVDPAEDAQDPCATLDMLARWVSEAADIVSRLRAAGVAVPLTAPGGDACALLDNVHVWAGVHPYHAARLNADAEVRVALLSLLDSGRCVGIGEFGLDFGPYNRCPACEQERAFATQLRLAHEYGLPVELHLRDPSPAADNPCPSPEAHLRAACILEREGVPAAGCDLHCFTAEPAVMQPFVELGCRIAFGGAVSFAKSDDIRAAAAACPSDRILTETDSPYMAPVPLRGQECEPGMVVFAADAVASARARAGVADHDATYRDLWRNACELFGLT